MPILLLCLWIGSRELGTYFSIFYHPLSTGHVIVRMRASLVVTVLSDDIT